MVRDLVDDRAAHLLDHLFLRVTDRADGQAVDGDPVGQHPRVPRCAAGERHSLVEPQQPARTSVVLDRDRHVAHEPAEIIGQRVQRRDDHLLEPVAFHPDHEPIVYGVLVPEPLRPTPADLAAARDQTIPDVTAPGLRVLFSGINPGLYSAATGYHFARPGNRFWPTLYRSGFTPRQFRPDEQEQLLPLGLGITNVVARAPARAGELTTEELREGGRALRAKAARLRPRWLAVVGVTAYRTAFGHADAAVGPQEQTVAAPPAWGRPQPSAPTPPANAGPPD